MANWSVHLVLPFFGSGSCNSFSSFQYSEVEAFLTRWKYHLEESAEFVGINISMNANNLALFLIRASRYGLGQLNPGHDTLHYHFRAVCNFSWVAWRFTVWKYKIGLIDFSKTWKGLLACLGNNLTHNHSTVLFILKMSCKNVSWSRTLDLQSAQKFLND